ncbi:hypothetical protein [Haladaptatus sp. DFWS20]|uniref:RPA family protein n=1 Tax=Haladaptatus sp. DFWS20 TaxID=3403467 RepID=UPI003EBE831F
MSSQGGAGRREVAWRIFAAEYNDSSLEHSDSDEERAPNYVVTPTGARINRLFVVGVLTEIEQVGDEVLRARIVDPTGGFVVYAGQYQPDALAFLERASPPMFVAVTGKARTFQPDDSELVYTSIRPESINEVDAETRDGWSVQTAEQTLARVRAFAQALDSDVRGDSLQQTLEANGVDEGLATGIPLALDHYRTTTPYLAGLQDVALDAARVVAGQTDEVRPLDVDPDEPGEAVINFDTSLETTGTKPEVTVTSEAEPVADTEADPATERPESTPGTEPESAPDTEPETATPPAEAREPELESEPENEPVDPETTATETVDADTVENDAENESFDTDDELDDFDSDESEDGLGDFNTPDSDSEPTDDLGDFDSDSSQTADDPDDLGDFDDQPMGEDVSGEMYEFEDGERERIEEEFGTEFSTGSEVDSAGEADIETPTPDVESDADSEPNTAAEPAEATGSDAEAGQPTQTEATEPEAAPDEVEDSEPEVEPETDAESDASDSASDKDVPGNLENAVMEAMKELNEGDGVERERLLAAVVDSYDVTPGDVEAALQDALMAGRCYESGEDTLKPI